MPYLSPFNAIQTTLEKEPSQYGITDAQSTDATSGVSALGQFGLAGASFSSSVALTFESVMSVSDGALTGTLILYNLTDAEVVATQTTSSTTPVAQTTTLTVGAAAGNIKLPAKIYEVRLSVSGALVTDMVQLGSAVIRTS